jgi:hypothetical protein
MRRSRGACCAAVSRYGGRTSSAARGAEGHLDLAAAGSGLLFVRTVRVDTCCGRAGAEQVERLMVEVKGMHRGAEALRAGASNGIAFLADTPRKGTRQRVPEEPPDLRSIAREERGAQTVQVVEHVSPRDWT